MATHELKTWPSVYPDVADGAKTVEIRFDDRGFHVGDTLQLNEYDPVDQRYTGRRCTRRVTHVLGGGQFGLQTGYVALSITDSGVDDRGPGALRPLPNAASVGLATDGSPTGRRGDRRAGTNGYV